MTTSSEHGPEETAPAFPTMEGGAVPAEEFFDGTRWNYLTVLDITNIPPGVIQDSLRGYLVRSCYEMIGAGNFNFWMNDYSFAISCHTVPAKVEMFRNRVAEAAHIFATNYLVKMNFYTMTKQD